MLRTLAFFASWPVLFLTLSPDAAARQVAPPVSAKGYALVVEVRDPTTGAALPRHPVSIVGTSVIEATDHNGVAILEFTASPGSSVTVFTQSAASAPGYADLELESPIEYVTLWAAPRRRFDTPTIDPVLGGEFVLEGPVSPYLPGASPMWVEVIVPPLALPEAGIISVSPIPAFAQRRSGGLDPFGLGTPYAAGLAEFEISLIRPDGSQVEAPQFSSAIRLVVRPWCFEPLGDWELSEPGMLRLRRLNESSMQLEVLDTAVGVDTRDRAFEFELSSFSRYAVTVTDSSEMPPEIIQKIGAWMYGWYCTGWSSGGAGQGSCACEECSNTPSPNQVIVVEPSHTCAPMAFGSVECGVVMQEIGVACASGGAIELSADLLHSMSLQLGVETSPLAAAIAKVAASVGHTATAGLSGALTLSSTRTGDARLHQGSEVSNKRGGACMSGMVSGVGKTTTYRVSVGGVGFDLPGDVCSGVGFTYDLHVDRGCSISASPPEDCGLDDGVQVTDTIDCQGS